VPDDGVGVADEVTWELRRADGTVERSGTAKVTMVPLERETDEPTAQEESDA
jgi:hypothetical protein